METTTTNRQQLPPNKVLSFDKKTLTVSFGEDKWMFNVTHWYYYTIGSDGQITFQNGIKEVGAFFELWCSDYGIGLLGPNSDGRNADGPNADGPNADGRNADGPNADGRNADGPNADGQRICDNIPEQEFSQALRCSEGYRLYLAEPARTEELMPSNWFLQIIMFLPILICPYRKYDIESKRRPGLSDMYETQANKLSAIQTNIIRILLIAAILFLLARLLLTVLGSFGVIDY